MGQLAKESTTAQSSAETKGRKTTRQPTTRASRTTQPRFSSNLERSRVIRSSFSSQAVRGARAHWPTLASCAHAARFMDLLRLLTLGRTLLGPLRPVEL